MQLNLLLKADMGFDLVMACLLISAAAVLILKSFGFKGAPLVAVIVGISLVSYYTDAVFGVSEVFSMLGSESGSSLYVSAALKVVGISYLSGISSDVCREIGETGIAKMISVATRLELTLLSLPFIKEIISSLLMSSEM